MSVPAMFLALFLIVCSLLPNTVLAQQGTVAAIAPPAIEMQPRDLPLTLELGSVTGELTATSPEGSYSAGASAFVQIRLRSETRKRRGDTARFVIEARHGTIVNITGSGVKVSDQEDGGREVSVNGIRKKRSRTVLIELKLAAVEQAQANALRLTLIGESGDAEQPQEAALRPATVTLKWPVANCGGAYHAALRRLGEGGGNELRQLWRQARKRDESMSRRWLFRPSVPSRREARRARNDGPGVSKKQERAIFRETRQLMRDGYDRILRRRGRYGWMIQKTASDLRKYFSQDMNPAICTGALQFVSYYEDKLAALGRRRTELTELATQAEKLARQEAEVVFARTRSLSGGHPAWGGSGVEAITASRKAAPDLQSLLVNMLQAARFPAERVTPVQTAQTPYLALERLDEDGLKAAHISQSMRRDMGQAAASIEAAVRLKDYRKRYHTFYNDFFSKLSGIRKAYTQHCVCSS